MVPRFFLLFSLLAVVQCKNYWGNPYPKAGPPKKVAVKNNVHVTPANWWTGKAEKELSLKVEGPDIEGYSAKLGAAKGVQLVNTEKGENANLLLLTLKISPTIKAQHVPIIFSKGPLSFTLDFPIFDSESQLRQRHH